MGTATYTEGTVSNFRTSLRARNTATMPVTIITGQNLAVGDVVGVITASGKATKSLTSASDGSEVPVGIVHIATDATSADVEGEVIAKGEVDFGDLNLTGTGWTETTIRLALQDRGIVLFKSITDSSTGVV